MSPERLGDAPVEQQYIDQMTAVMGALDSVFNGDMRPRKTGVVVLVFPYTQPDGTGTDGRCNFMSNGANRDDIVTLMKEMIARFEGQPETTGRA